MRRAILSISLVAVLASGPAVATSAIAGPASPSSAASASGASARAVGHVTASPLVVGRGVAAKTFSNCKTLNARYPGGVAKDKKARNTKTVGGRKVAASSSYKPKVSASLYAANKSKDRDKDGIACER